MRWACLLHGAAIALGAAAVVDNLLVHRILGWHHLAERTRGAPYAWSEPLEWSLVAVGALLLVWGIWRAARAEPDSQQA